VRLSIVDLAAVPVGGGPRQALEGAVALARQAERLGYERYWLAEHHGMGDVITSSNPEARNAQ
jgi:alkanesulfonate monooxygenase SsuD/methylene tetrahydromethanopterin reductase-like flavin-dependent oxidoreductase (luciferase family)